MNSFPIISIAQIQAVFDVMRNLYVGDKLKIIEGASRATAGEGNPIIVSTGQADPQIDLIRNRLSRTADNYGRQLLVRLIEELHNDLIASGAIGVGVDDFFSRATIKTSDNSTIKLNADGSWSWNWILTVDDNPHEVVLGLRSKAFNPSEIVPAYILEFVQQAFIAYKQNRSAAALSLMTIALEGTLRDALFEKGYNYTPGTPKEDIFELQDMHIHKNPAGFLVTFPNPMPLNHNDYLSAAGDPTFKSVKIKRLKKGANFLLEIRDCSDVLNYWSSGNVVTAGVRQVTGLGAAIDIGRNTANIIQPIDLPPDLDRVIQTVRNNLIHLSGTAMTSVVQPGVTLGDFLKDKNRVFDAVCTIGDTIGAIYKKLTSGTL